MKLREFFGPERSVRPNLAKFGSYLAKFGHEIFFGRGFYKIKKVCGVSFEGYFIKKISYWTWQSANFCTFLVIARSKNSFFL